MEACRTAPGKSPGFCSIEPAGATCSHPVPGGCPQGGRRHPVRDVDLFIHALLIHALNMSGMVPSAMSTQPAPSIFPLAWPG